MSEVRSYFFELCGTLLGFCLRVASANSRKVARLWNVAKATPKASS